MLSKDRRPGIGLALGLLKWLHKTQITLNKVFSATFFSFSLNLSRAQTQTEIQDRMDYERIDKVQV